MRQGETAPKGAWIGNPSGGVKAPEPIILPDPGLRFSRSAERLEQLADGHAAEGWLAFMAEVSRAQAAAAACPSTPRVPDQAAIAQAVAARIPPIAADGHRRDAVWRDGLAVLLESFDAMMFPPSTATAIADLRRRDDPENGKPRRRLPAGRRRRRRRGRGFLDRGGVAGLFHRALGNAASRRPQTFGTPRSLPLLRLDFVSKRNHRLRPKPGRALSLLLALLDRLASHSRRLHRLRRLAYALAARL